MAAPTFGSAGAYLAPTSSNTATIAPPPGLAAGDGVLIVLYKENNNAVTLNNSGASAGFPTGTTLIGTAVVDLGGSRDFNLYVYWRRAVSSEPDYRLDWTDSNWRTGFAVRYTGVPAAGSIVDAFDIATRDTNGTTTPAVAVTTSGADRKLVWIGAQWDVGTWTAPSGYSARTGSGWPSSRLLGLADDDQALDGPTGNVTGSATGSYTQAAVLVALAPSGPSEVEKSASDSAQGTDAAFALQPRAGADAGSGTDSAGVAIPFAGSDSGTGSDVAFAGIPMPSSDAGSTGEAVSMAGSVAGLDARTGSDSLHVDAELDAGVDPAEGDDAAHIIIPADDENAGTDETYHVDADLQLVNTGHGGDGAVVETLFGDLVISLYAIDPDDGSLVPLPDFAQLVLSPERNAAGSITLQYPVNGLNFDFLREAITSDRDLEVEIWTSGSDDGARRGYLAEAQGDDVDEGTNTWTFAGRFLEQRMSEAVVWPQDQGPLIPSPLPAAAQAAQLILDRMNSGDSISEDWTWSGAPELVEEHADELLEAWEADEDEPDAEEWLAEYIADATDDDPSDNEHANEARELIFSAATPGEVIAYIMEQAQDRGALAELTWDFSATEDSNGTEWPNVISTKFSPGVTYDQILSRLVEFSLVEWAVVWDGTDKVLKLWIPEGRGTDLTVGDRPVILRRGRTLLDAPRKWTVRDSATALLAIGGEGVYDDASDADAQSRRGRRIEVAASANNLVDETAVAAWMQSQLSTVVGGLMEVNHGIGFLPGEPRPIVAFDIGDWVYSQVGTTTERLRVVQWTLTVDQQQNPAGAVTLNDTVQDGLQRLQGRLNALTAGETVVGTSTSSQIEDSATPMTPTGVIVGSTAFLDELGAAHAAVTVSWDAVTLNDDGTAVTDLAGYKVQHAYDAEPTAWIGVEDVGPNRNDATFDASAGVQLACRVAAYDENGNVSAWSDPVSHSTEMDTTPPGVPSAPTVSNWLGTLRIAWDGETADGTEMHAAAPDFDVVQIHMSEGSLFTPDATTQVGYFYGPGAWVVTDLPYGVEQFVRLVAVDNSGNASEPSAQGSASTSKLVNIDLGPDAVDRANIVAAAIGSAEIDTLAVNDAHMANVSMGKVTAGQIKASMIFTSGGLIGSRAAGTGLGWEGDSAGIRFYNSSNTKTIEFKSTDGSALVTGTYMSGTTGQRIRLDPDGSARWYGTSGTDYASIENDNAIVRMRSRTDEFGRRSYVDFNPIGFKAWYGTPSSARSVFDLGLTYGVIAAPVTGIRVLNAFNPTDGSENRFHFVFSDDDGDDIGRSVLHYIRNSHNGNDPAIIAVGLGDEGAGISFGNNKVTFTRGDGNATVPIAAGGFVTESTELVKRDIAPIRHSGLTSLDIVDRVRSYQWYYEYDGVPSTPRTIPLQRRQPDGSLAIEQVPVGGNPEPARLRYFPIAEHLQKFAPELISTGARGQLHVSLGDTVGLLWDAVQQLSTQVRELRGEPDGPVIVEGQVLDPSRWAELPRGEQ